MPRPKKMHCDNCTTEDPIHGTLHPKWLPIYGPWWECQNCRMQKPRRVLNTAKQRRLDALMAELLAASNSTSQEN